MKKDCEKTIEDVSNMKNKYNNINEKMKDINKALSGNISFEQIQEDILFRVKVNQKIDDFEQKFRVVLGDYDADDNEIEDKKRNKIKFLTNDREKNKSILKKNKNDKLFNLIEINKRINQYQNSKVSISDNETKYMDIMILKRRKQEKIIIIITYSQQKMNSKITKRKQIKK